ncbi:MAG: TetR/AcrR family transcriptional regulator [Vicinamibacteria bacterium]
MSKSTKEKLVAATRALMLRNGYGATGVDQICTSAGVSKGSFYHCFATKEDIAIAALDDFYAEAENRLKDLPLPPVPDAQRFLAFLDVLAGDAGQIWQNGCLLGGLASEMSATSPAIQARLGELFDQMVRTLEPLARPFVKSLGKSSMTAAEMVEHLLIVVEGAIVLARSHSDPTRINHAIKSYGRFLRNLQKSPPVAARKSKETRKSKERR